MNFVEAWPEIQKFLLEAAKAESGDEVDELPAGGGDAAVTELENRLGTATPEEFQFYIRNVSSFHFLAFYQGFELFSYEELGFEKSEEWGDFPEAEDIISVPLVIGQDTSIAFVTDLDDMACPVYCIDEVNDWNPELMASSLADFLYLLSYRESLHQRRFAYLEMREAEDKARTEADYKAMKDNIEALAPDCTGQWNLHEFGIEDV